MLTSTLLSYRLSRWKLMLAYLALIPLVYFAMFELLLSSFKGHEWVIGIAIITTALAVGSTFRRWSRFVTEMYCTEAGIHFDTVIGGNRDIAWNRVLGFRQLIDFGREFIALEITDELPLYLYMGEETRAQLVTLLGKFSTAAVAGFD